MITVASLAGFCFGVKRAVDRVIKLSENKAPGERIFTIGNLIHNPIVIDELTQKGVHALPQDESLLDRLTELCREASPDAKVSVIIRTHGVRREILEHAMVLSGNNPSFICIDCTCPYVQKIHRIVAEQTTPDSRLIIIGDKNHPEVDGIRSWAAGNVAIFASESEIEDEQNCQKQTIMVSQTTQKLTEWKKCQNKIRNLYTNALIFDTICSVTENRQTECETLSREVDLMLVIGGRNSSNTAKLYEVAKRNQSRSYLIERADELSGIPMTPDMNVGITAGASTPSSIIEEVYQTMSETMENEVLDFEKMIDESFKTLYTGAVVKGIITCVLNNEIHVDLGAKSTGVIAFDELTDNPQAKLSDLYKVGDEIEAKVVKVSDLDGIA
ncbi:MAG: 4-hydroxy-3-methylbut-2-enyl diphosphate reductase, partial [Clostridia bacterium]|nr:4-hydroxy-3-methylbut-2-enyl diphosphate reductase [Clostridia bacterium]